MRDALMTAGAMPRYFFHVFDDDVAIDEEGLDLPDPAAAESEALKGARALACEQVSQGHLHLDHRVEVTDENGAAMHTISFRNAVNVTG